MREFIPKWFLNPSHLVPQACLRCLRLFSTLTPGSPSVLLGDKLLLLFPQSSEIYLGSHFSKIFHYMSWGPYHRAPQLLVQYNHLHPGGNQLTFLNPDYGKNNSACILYCLNSNKISISYILQFKSTSRAQQSMAFSYPPLQTS